MMKNISLILTLCCTVSICTAQIRPISDVTTQSVAKTPDTTKAVIKHVKTRVIGGGVMASDKDIVDNIVKSKDHTIFTGSLVAASLTETLKSRGPLTIFAPTNNAFGQLPAGTLDTLTKVKHNADLTRLLAYHVIAGRYTSKDIAKKINEGKGEATFVTLAGAKLKARINGDRNIVLVDEKGNESIISQFDIEQSNGIMDVVTAVLIPTSR